MTEADWLRPCEQEVARELLEEELESCGCRYDVLRGRTIEEIFNALVRAPTHGRWKAVAEELGYKSHTGAIYLVRHILPRILSAYPRILNYLASAAGQKGVEMNYTEVSERRRLELIQQFWEDFSELTQQFLIGEIGVEFTGSPQGVVLFHLIRRFYRARWPLGVFFAELPKEPIDGLSEYLEHVRMYYGLDPVSVNSPEALSYYEKGDLDGYLKETFRVLKAQTEWRVLVKATEKGDPILDTGSGVKGAKLPVRSFLDEWTIDDLMSYADLQQLVLFEPVRKSLLLARQAEENDEESEIEPESEEPEEESEGNEESEIDLSRWNRKHGRYTCKGVSGFVAAADVPEKVKKHFEEQEDGAEDKEK